jgi:hypothetical protein
MQLAAKEDEGLHRFGAEAISFTAIGYTFGVRKGKVRILFVETRKRKVSSKVSSQRDKQPTTHQTNQPVKKQKLRRAQGGSKESTKAQALETFSNLSFIGRARGISGGLRLDKPGPA